MKPGKKEENLAGSFQPMSETFLRDRGWCCGCGCRHCPYDYQNVPAPLRDIKRREKAEREAAAAASGESGRSTDSASFETKSRDHGG